MIIAFIWTACFIPLWLLPDSFVGLSLGGAFLQVSRM